MNQINTCPDKEILIDFLSGKLDEMEVVATEEHLSECVPCLETMHDLESLNDTYSDLARHSIEDGQIANHQSSSLPEDKNTIQRLVEELKSFSRPGVSSTDTTDGTNAADVLSSRTAEVTRLLAPPREPNDLGYLEGYRIVCVLGAGSTGVVFQAIQESLNRKVALKILRPSLGEPAKVRFVAEAQATAKLDHPNAISIYEVGEVNSLAFIAMQWVPGETLENRLNREPVLSIELVRQLTEQLASALGEAHQHGLIHRDVKPANIWIGETGDVKLLDFGLVRIANESPQLTCTGMIAGTPCFMSPEQSRGQQLDGRSDLFSLGCVAYRALTGKLPFEGENALSTLQAIQRSRPSPPHELDPNIPVEFSELVLRLLEKSPNKRPQSAQQFIDALDQPSSAWTLPKVDHPKTAHVPQHDSSFISNYWKAVVLIFLTGCLAWGGFLYGSNIIRIVMNQGVIEIKTEVQDVSVEVFKNGESVRIVDLSTDKSIVVEAGKYEIRPLGDENSVHIENGELVLMRGNSAIVRVLNHVDVNQNRDANSQQNVGAGSIPGRSDSSSEFPIPSPVELANYRIQPGAILGIFVEGVLGEFDKAPPVNIPESQSGLSPSIGFPIMVSRDGSISLPLVKPIPLNGLTVSEAEKLVKQAFVAGSQPICKEEVTVLVSLIRPHDPRQPNSDYAIDRGAILGIFVEGVLGTFDGSPKIHLPQQGRDVLPSLGYPIAVNEKGTISLPLVDLISVSGLSVRQAEEAVKEAYWGGDAPILKKSARIIVTLMRRHDFKPNGSIAAVDDRSSKEDHNVPLTGTANPPAESKLDQLKEQLNAAKQAVEDGRADPNSLNDVTIKYLTEANKQSKTQDRFIETALDLIETYERILLDKNQDDADAKQLQLPNTILADGDELRLELTAIRRKLSNYERERGLPQSQPVFDGRTYEEWLEIARTDRDVARLNPALRGIANLSTQLERQEVLATVMRVFERERMFATKEQLDELSKFYQSYFRSLDAKTSAQLLIDEITAEDIPTLTKLQGYLRHFEAIAKGKPELQYRQKVLTQIAQAGLSKNNEMSELMWQWLETIIQRYQIHQKENSLLVELAKIRLRKNLESDHWSGTSENVVFYRLLGGSDFAMDTSLDYFGDESKTWVQLAQNSSRHRCFRDLASSLNDHKKIDQLVELVWNKFYEGVSEPHLDKSEVAYFNFFDDHVDKLESKYDEVVAAIDSNATQNARRILNSLRNSIKAFRSKENSIPKKQ